MADKVKFSRNGLAYGAAVDVDALSDRASQVADHRRVIIATAAGQKQTAVFTQNATVKHNLGPIGRYATLAAAYVSCETLVAGGALTVGLVAYDASANAEVVLTATLNPEAFTVREGAACTLAATNVALDPDDTLELHCVADNVAVTQDAQGVSVTCLWDPTEATVPTR